MDEIAIGAEISKPVIYQYFKNKDELYFHLMIPVIEDIGSQLKRVEKRLIDNKYVNGKDFLSDMFHAFYHSYKIMPDTFRIVQIFQQSGLVAELDTDTREAMNKMGRYNFNLGRQILSMAIEKNLIHRVNPSSLADLLWGLIVGVIQLEDIKGDDKQGNRFKRLTLKLAEDVICKALATNEDSDA